MSNASHTPHDARQDAPGADASPAPLVAVTGATGFVGREVVRLLLRRGVRVRVLARETAKAWRVLPGDARLDVVEGGVFNDEARQRLCEGADSVIHLIGVRREVGGATFQRMHVEAAARMLESARDAGVRRFIHMSALGSRSGAPSKYHQSKIEGENLVRRSGLDWTILRPSVIHGPEGEFMQMAKGWVTGQAPPKFFLPYFEQTGRPIDERRAGEHPRASLVQPVHVGDVAWAVCECLTRPETIREVYPLGGPEALTWPQLLEVIRDLVPGAKASLKPVGVPANWALVAARAAGAIGAGALLPFGPDDVLMATEDSTCSNVKAGKHLGYEPSHFAGCLREYASQIR